MLGLGAWEMGMVLLVALVVLGPDKIPEVARKLARLVGQVRRVADDVRRNVDEALREDDAAAAQPPPKAAFTQWIEEQQARQAASPPPTSQLHGGSEPPPDDAASAASASSVVAETRGGEVAGPAGNMAPVQGSSPGKDLARPASPPGERSST